VHSKVNLRQDKLKAVVNLLYSKWQGPVVEAEERDLDREIGNRIGEEARPGSDGVPPESGAASAAHQEKGGVHRERSAVPPESEAP